MIVDAVLVVGAVRHVNQTPPPVDIPVVRAGETPETPPSPSSTPEQPDFDFQPARAAAVSVANDDTLLYALRGACKGDNDNAGKVTVSTNGGASTVTVQTGLEEILAVSAVSRTELRIVGADDACDVQRLRSSDGGDTWETDPEDDLWYPDPTSTATVVSPEGRTKPGCTVTSLSQVGDTFARVSCADGVIRGTGDGKKWLKLGRLDNVRVASFTNFNAGVALAVYQGCAANAFTTRDSGRTWAPGGCISGEPAQAIAASDSGLVAIVDAQLYVSDDAGRKWRQP
ncbi:hypothetical protein C3E78_00445 [Aeromicrobium chenweiae]|uniref:Exo-alpha-sialidase n=1 Tax=Aeromicrobium chenweiae TaxID=2079793 RepID=A0A2S0WHM1_9ACTN|nr:hypothetical protein C3E78_00445 [Aeromicrobium chenweiae]